MPSKPRRPDAAPAPRRQASGNWNPDWESFARLDPAWTEKVVALAMAPAIAGALDAKTTELILIALASSSARLDGGMVRRYVRRALDQGATRAEITAVLQLAALQGMTSFCVGAPILLEELERRDAAAPANSTRRDSQGTP